jgi:hypothetical protein
VLAKNGWKVVHLIILDENNDCPYCLASMCKVFQSLSSTFLKVNNLNVDTLNVVNANLSWLCNLRHGWLCVSFPHGFFTLIVIMQACKDNMSIENKHILILDNHHNSHVIIDT